jgi:hypothetical protein
MTTTTTPKNWRVTDGTVPLADVVRTAQCSRASIDYAASTGLVSVVRKGGRGNARHISLEDALLIVGVAALAVAAGLAFGILLRTIRDTGGKVTPAGIVIPVPFPVESPAAA